MRLQTHPRARWTSAGSLGTREGWARQSGCVWGMAGDIRGLGGELVMGEWWSWRPAHSCWDSGTPRAAARSYRDCCAPTVRFSAPAAT